MWSITASLPCFNRAKEVSEDTSLIRDISHTNKGTVYGQKAISAYADSNHGPDGSLFLDPFFKTDLEKLRNVKVLDAGCGSAPWSIYAAKEGGDVYAIDIQEGMIQAAKKAIQTAKLEDKIKVMRGDVAALPYQSNFFDKAISICVACNLPLESFEPHFVECKRTLKKNGIAIFGAPSSLDIVFTDGVKSSQEVSNHIQEVLDNLPDNPSAELISQSLIQLQEVLSATFYIKDGRLVLLTNEKHLKDGDAIWRKLPKLIVPNYFYSKDSYFGMFKKHGLKIEQEDFPCFKDESERIEFNNSSFKAKLGSEYVLHNPFMIFHVRKTENQFSFWKVIDSIKKIATVFSEKIHF